MINKYLHCLMQKSYINCAIYWWRWWITCHRGNQIDNDSWTHNFKNRTGPVGRTGQTRNRRGNRFGLVIGSVMQSNQREPVRLGQNWKKPMTRRFFKTDQVKAFSSTIGPTLHRLLSLHRQPTLILAKMGERERDLKRMRSIFYRVMSRRRRKKKGSNNLTYPCFNPR
jgi:hypothetical protein